MLKARRYMISQAEAVHVWHCQSSLWMEILFYAVIEYRTLASHRELEIKYKFNPKWSYSNFLINSIQFIFNLFRAGAAGQLLDWMWIFWVRFLGVLESPNLLIKNYFYPNSTPVVTPGFLIILYDWWYIKHFADKWHILLYIWLLVLRVR